MTELGRNVGFSGQCFPVRSLTKNNVLEEDVGGAWLVAYKAEQRRRFKAVLCREPDVVLPGKPNPARQRVKTRNEDEEETRRKLDGFYLMKLFHVNDPLDLCSINICGKGLNQVNEEDFSMFKNVIHVDAGENNLKLIHFRKFLSLRELELPLNDLSGSMNIEEKDFLCLETLDLSCNNLTCDDILALGILPALKVLHLTGNSLNELPPEMSRSCLLSEERKKPRFANLEKLWLDQNDLTDVNTFTSLAGLKRLQYLNLADNNISSVPHLKLLGQKSDLDLNSNGHKSSVKNTGLIAKDRLQVLGPITNVDEVLESELADVNSKIDTLKDILYNINNEEVDAVNNSIERESVSRAHGHLKDLQVLPFPSLQHLNLTNNYIEEEEGLLALSTWPRLQELVIWGNPVASCRKEGPPAVSYYLGLLAGIDVIRHRPSKKQKKLTSLAINKHPRRVQNLPPVSHNKKLSSLEASKYLEIAYEGRNEVRPLPPITAPCKESKCQNLNPKRVSSAPVKEQEQMKNYHVSKEPWQESPQSVPAKLRSADCQGSIQTEGRSSCVEETSDFSQRHSEAPPPEDRVFLTQVDDVDDAESLFFNDEEPKPELRKPANIPAKPVSIAKKYEGYEHLLNIDEEYADDGKLPSDIHGNVRALQYALDHPLIFTDHSSKHLVRSITKRKKQKVVSTKMSSRTTTVEELGNILDKMRTHSKTVESNLGDVLKEFENPKIKEFRDAKRLLNEVQAKYDEVRHQSLNSTAIAANIMKRELIHHDVKEQSSPMGAKK